MDTSAFGEAGQIAFKRWRSWERQEAMKTWSGGVAEAAWGHGHRRVDGTAFKDLQRCEWAFAEIGNDQPWSKQVNLSLWRGDTNMRSMETMASSHPLVQHSTFVYMDGKMANTAAEDHPSSLSLPNGTSSRSSALPPMAGKSLPNLFELFSPSNVLQ